MNAMTSVLWIDISAVDDVPLQSARRVDTPLGPVAVFRTLQGEVFALRDRCPHKGGPLSEGIVHGKAVACPLHNWSIDLETGQPRGADAGKGCTPKVGVRIEDGRVLLALAG